MRATWRRIQQNSDLKDDETVELARLKSVLYRTAMQSNWLAVYVTRFLLRCCLAVTSYPVKFDNSISNHRRVAQVAHSVTATVGALVPSHKRPADSIGWVGRQR